MSQLGKWLAFRLADVEHMDDAEASDRVPYTADDIKLFLIWRLLQARARWPNLFRSASYTPLAIDGARAEHLCAFMREAGDVRLVVVVARLMTGLVAPGAAPRLAVEVWRDEVIILPELETYGNYWDIITGVSATPRASSGGGLLRASRLLPLPWPSSRPIFYP